MRARKRRQRTAGSQTVVEEGRLDDGGRGRRGRQRLDLLYDGLTERGSGGSISSTTA
jgi:hypothetical protein